MWPSTHIPDTEFKDIMLEYYDTMDKLQLKLMRYIASGLALSNPQSLVDKCNDHHENLRLLHYPTIANSSSNSNTFIRGQPHTDFGSLTLLVQDSVGGLKVQRNDKTWIDVEPVDNSIIVNVGEMLMRVTDDRLKATLHKVEAPPAKEDGCHGNAMIPERYSIAFFCNFNKDVVLESVLDSDSDSDSSITKKHPPINAHQYITKRLRDTINN
jgi:isopenicillin N synthase-like dioxygenase